MYHLYKKNKKQKTKKHYAGCNIKYIGTYLKKSLLKKLHGGF